MLVGHRTTIGAAKNLSDLGSGLDGCRSHVGGVEQQELPNIPLVDLEMCEEARPSVGGVKHQDVARVKPHPHRVEHSPERLDVHFGGRATHDLGAVYVVVMEARSWVHDNNLLPATEGHPEQLVPLHLTVLYARHHHTPHLLVRGHLPRTFSLQGVWVEEVNFAFGCTYDTVFQRLQALELLAGAHNFGVGGFCGHAVCHIEDLEDSIFQAQVDGSRAHRDGHHKMLEGECIDEFEVCGGVDVDFVGDEADPDLRADAAHAYDVVTWQRLEGVKAEQAGQRDAGEVHHPGLHQLPAAQKHIAVEAVVDPGESCRGCEELVFFVDHLSVTHQNAERVLQLPNKIAGKWTLGPVRVPTLTDDGNEIRCPLSNWFQRRSSDCRLLP